MDTVTTVLETAELIRARRADHEGATLLVGISGFGGSGKSTLAAALAVALQAPMVSIDEFQRVPEIYSRSNEWSGFDRERLRQQVLEPARAGATSTYQVFDMEQEALGEWRDLGRPPVLLVEGCSVFHPDIVALFDLTIWIDMSLLDATAQGMKRDRESCGSPQVQLWQDVWVPNEWDFFERFRPDEAAALHYRQESAS